MDHAKIGVARNRTATIPGEEDTACCEAGDAVDVSVVIPCLNEERFIGKTLENLASQHDRRRYEIIVVDGMSKDNTCKIVSEFSARNPDARLRLVANPAKCIPV